MSFERHAAAFCMKSIKLGLKYFQGGMQVFQLSCIYGVKNQTNNLK